MEVKIVHWTHKGSFPSGSVSYEVVAVVEDGRIVAKAVFKYSKNQWNLWQTSNAGTPPDHAQPLDDTGRWEFGDRGLLRMICDMEPFRWEVAVRAQCPVSSASIPAVEEIGDTWDGQSGEKYGRVRRAGETQWGGGCRLVK